MTSAATEWSDYHNHAMVSLPTTVPSSDLFDGELFGDELMDIYNSAVEATAQNPDLSIFLDGTDEKKDDADAMLSSAEGDGFGTFRPSTSFNDLTTILNAHGEVIVKQHDEDQATPMAVDPPPPKEKKTKKRSSTNGANGTGSPTKRRAAANKRTKEPEVAPEAAPSSMPPPQTDPKPVTPEYSNAVAVVNDPVPEAALMSGEESDMTPESSDFQALAEAAVSSLIQSVSAENTDKLKDKVDVSTPHIKALTGNNWVAACAATTATQGITTTTASTATTATDAAAAAAADPNSDAANANRVRRQSLTPDERARQNRDRNREHARNTRLRKKAYVEELKKTLTELVAQRDASEQEKRQAAQREIEQREVRFRVMEEFLKLRGRNEANQSRWAAILEDGFTLTLPSTDFRKMAKGEMTLGEERTLTGVSEVMGDAASFSTFLQSIGGGGDTTVSCQFSCDRKQFFMDGCQAVLEWEATSSGAVANGAKNEISFRGVVRGKYSPASNKLLSAHITCDVGVLLLKLQKAANRSSTENAAAQAAEADALIESLQIPLQVPSAVIVHPSSDSSVGDESS